ncbi:MAG TPA: hypothetical protein VM141_07755 [Planctomycetota bacterium]|nr:hypothetical protein [Planctomycetota bacterium]
MTAIDVDKLDQLWVVDHSYWPKRVSVWSTDGTFKKEFLGPTQYGGGGVLDPYDKTKLYYGPLEFELHWEKGATRLKNLMWTGSSRPAYDLEQQQKAVYARARVIDCFPRKTDIRIDGGIDDWESVSASLDEEDPMAASNSADFRITYDDKYLYVCFSTRHMGPLKNSGQQWDRLFKTGASVDIQMGTDPQADAARKGAVDGDLRLLMTMMNGKPIAVLYKPVVPGTPEDKQWHCVSPVVHITFDHVAKAEEVRIAARTDDNSFTLEAAIPLKTMGLKITPNVRLSFDWGVLVSGKDGNEVLRRVYWSNKATSIVADAPSEAVLHPDLWGMIRFHAKDAKSLDVLDPMGTPDVDKGTKDFLDDLEEDLK